MRDDFDDPDAHLDMVTSGRLARKVKLLGMPRMSGDPGWLAELVADLTAALRKYGKHKQSCNVNKGLAMPRSCTCGLDAALGEQDTPAEPGWWDSMPMRLPEPEQGP